MTGLLTGLALGALRAGMVDVLVILALLVITIAAVGLVLAHDPVTRLHFLAPASTLALPCFGAAAVIEQGLGLGSAAIVLTVVAGALSSPVLTTSIARLVAAEDADRPASRSVR
ncbi:hypothetical protein GCM10011575_07940 [Microlunatus endophyticus]|uniref:Uncharacterized protein n=1 Tax=Microlunatus endophyticus TaxID=1716077 RepID=A0A917W1P2_9ACTN|nr:monovalent cation/H(+) antiporter subunit G [Microlunatus endophyticus]GGL52118.1 hypothetical protein GCM10011575_07940 [Microlunatus endophyticus]